MIRRVSASVLPLVLLCGLRAEAAATSLDACTGFIDALPVVLDRGGTWCLRGPLTLAEDGAAAITIAANNVTVDCNGHALAYAGHAGTAPAGVYSPGENSVGVANASVRACSLRGFRGAIVLAGTGHLVEDNLVDGAYVVGISVDADRSAVRGNRVGGVRSQLASEGATGIMATAAVHIEGNLVHDVRVTHAASDQPAVGIDSRHNAGGRIGDNMVTAVASAGSGVAIGIRIQLWSRALVHGNFVANPLPGDPPDSVGIDCAGGAVESDNEVVGFGVPTRYCVAGQPGLHEEI